MSDHHGRPRRRQRPNRHRHDPRHRGGPHRYRDPRQCRDPQRYRTEPTRCHGARVAVVDAWFSARLPRRLSPAGLARHLMTGRQRHRQRRSRSPTAVAAVPAEERGAVVADPVPNAWPLVWCLRGESRRVGVRPAAALRGVRCRGVLRHAVRPPGARRRAVLRSGERRRDGRRHAVPRRGAARVGLPAAERFSSGGLVHDGAFDRTCPTLVELEPARQRLDAHLQILHLDAQGGWSPSRGLHHLVLQLIEGVALAASRFASRSAIVTFSFDWMFNAWISGFGLKNSFRIGCSSRRMKRSGPRVESKIVSASNV